MCTLARAYVNDIDRNNQMFLSVLNTLYSGIILTEENKMFTLISKKVKYDSVYHVGRKKQIVQYSVYYCI